MLTHHGTVVAYQGKGVLLRGISGSGKSDLAVRLIAAGAELVADDRVVLERAGEGLVASCPQNLASLIELRGIGIMALPFRPQAEIALVVDLVDSGDVERLPESSRAVLEGLFLPVVRLDAFEASTPIKILWVLEHRVLANYDIPVAGAGARLGYKKGFMSEIASFVRAPQSVESTIRLLLVTGMSGAGRSSSLKILEDLGYEAVDNLPLSLLPRLIGRDCSAQRPLAVGIDIRTRDFAVGGLLDEIEELRLGDHVAVNLVFLDCEDETLARRFTETRRRHPLAGDRPVSDGIQLERERLLPLRVRADILIDTTGLRLGDLKRVLSGYFVLADHRPLSVFVTSFSFREGLPREADLVFDVRFLQNPHYDPELRPLTGKDAAVGAFIERDPGFADFWKALTALLRPLLPRYDHEGKSYLTIAIGCTGGRHRSVFMAERLAQWIEAEGQSVTLAHREIDGKWAPDETTAFAAPAPAKKQLKEICLRDHENA